MSFWASQTIESRLESILDEDTRKWKKKKKCCDIDCNALTLRVGGEAYVSPRKSSYDDGSHAISILKEGQSVTIPPGQFAFLLTKESFTIPKDVMALISIKATLKFKGLVNVSGFHVDPGFRGQLVFAVFNAGPQPVILREGMEAFLMWFANIVNDHGKQVESDNNRADKPEKKGIDAGVVNGIMGEVYSFSMLLDTMRQSEKTLSQRIESLEKEQTVIKWATLLIAAAIGGWAVRFVLP
ncbi:MAG: hypothetical protein LDL44_02460 [Caenispirillum sp.]|nr:hypothetical protein [Caenispirillum sp.]